MSDELDLGLTKILQGDIPSYVIQKNTQSNQLTEEKSMADSSAVMPDIIIATEVEQLQRSEEPENNLPIELESKTEIKAFTIEAKDVVETESIPQTPMENAYQSANWTELKSISEQELNSNSQNWVAKAYWSLASLKLNEIRADLIAIGLSGIWQDELPQLATEEQDELKKILIPTSDLCSLECQSIDSELAAKLRSFLPIKVAESAVTMPIESVIPTAVLEVDGGLVDFKKHLDSLNAPAVAEPTKNSISNTVLVTEPLSLSTEESASKYSRTSIILLSLFLTLTVASVYLYWPQTEERIELVSEQQQIQAQELAEQPLKVIKDTDLAIQEDAQGPLAMIIDQMEESPEVVVEEEQDKMKIVTVTDTIQPLKLSGPPEPAELRDLLDGRVPEESEDSVDEKKEDQNNVMDEYLRKGPIVDERVGGARPSKVDGDVVSVIRDTSLFNRPDAKEAEIMLLYIGDELRVVEDLGEWLKVDAFGRVYGYVQRNKVR